MIIGVDPHKGSHTATAVSPTMNTPASPLRIDATLAPGTGSCSAPGTAFPERQWAVDNAHGLGRHLAQWLIARGETVIDVHTTATARVRELSRGGRRKTDVLDASAAASVAAARPDGTSGAVPQCRGVRELSLGSLPSRWPAAIGLAAGSLGVATGSPTPHCIWSRSPRYGCRTASGAATTTVR